MLDPVRQGSGHVGCRVSGDAICSFPHKVIITQRRSRENHTGMGRCDITENDTDLCLQ